MNLVDKIVSVFSPQKAFERVRYRKMASMVDSSWTSASSTKRSLKSWGIRSSINPDEEVLKDFEKLRNRSRDLFKNNPIGSGAIRKVVTNVVGSGLSFQSRIDREYLGLTDEQADNWENSVEREFRNWSDSTDADAGRRLNFNEIQELAFLSVLQSGEVFALLPMIKRNGSIYDLRVQLIEADRVSNPFGKMDNEKVAGGIEVGSYGEPIAYYIMTNPAFSQNINDWKRVTAFGNQSGRYNVLHLYRQERPGQRRGTPYLSTVIDTIKTLGRYTDSELTAALISSMFTVFVKSPQGDSNILGNVIPEDERADSTGENYELAPGAIVGLGEGEEIEVANPNRPNTGFDSFVQSLLRQVGMALELPYELLISHFQASYSASRAALLEAWKTFKTKRLWLSKKFCQPIYEEWLTQAVLSGRIKAPGFFDDISIKKAYCGAEWIGQAPGQIDPVKETTAAQMRVESGFSTLSEETASIVGGDWERKIRQRAKENRLMIELDLKSDDNQAVIGDENESQE